MRSSAWLALAVIAPAPVLAVEGTVVDHGVIAAPSVQNIRVYPNPWRADHDQDKAIVFDRLPSNSTLKIFSLDGKLVRTLDASSGVVSWDRKNGAGDYVASGMYLYHASNPAGQEFRGKLAIIR